MPLKNDLSPEVSTGSSLINEASSDGASQPSPWLQFLKKHRLVFLIGLHSLLFCFVYWCAFLMRFSLIVPDKYVELYSISVGPVIAIKLIVFYCLHSFHAVSYTHLTLPTIYSV